MLKNVTSTEANRNFSEIARLVDSGVTVIVTKHGEPSIRMERVNSEMLQREAARKALIERLDSQAGVKSVTWTRGELYDDDEA